MDASPSSDTEELISINWFLCCWSVSVLTAGLLGACFTQCIHSSRQSQERGTNGGEPSPGPGGTVPRGQWGVQILVRERRGNNPAKGTPVQSAQSGRNPRDDKTQELGGAQATGQRHHRPPTIVYQDTGTKPQRAVPNPRARAREAMQVAVMQAMTEAAEEAELVIGR